MYQHDSSRAWPTLGEMIQDCKQVLFFYVRGADGNPPLGNPNGIHFFFDYATQTRFSHETVESLEGNPCEISRAGTQQDFVLFNDFILDKGIAPSIVAAEKINTGAFVEPIVAKCEAELNHPVNFVSVDYWKTGDLPDFIIQHNQALVANESAKAQVTASIDFCRDSKDPTAPPSSSLLTDAPSSVTVESSPSSSAINNQSMPTLMCSTIVSWILLSVLSLALQ